MSYILYFASTNVNNIKVVTAPQKMRETKGRQKKAVAVPFSAVSPSIASLSSIFFGFAVAILMC